MKKRLLLVGMLAAPLLAGCLVGGRGEVGFVVPALPSIVILESEPYYEHGGYYYYYRNDSWFYSRSRSGPWNDLPRDRYPKEVRFKGRGEGEGGGRDEDRGRGEKRGHDGRD